MKIVREELCRICKGELKTVLDFGEIYPSGFLKENEELSKLDKAPLELTECTKCGLIQLRHTIDLDLMYRQYWYASSLNKSMVTSLKDIINDVESRIDLLDDDIVVDIGCNDGTMLSLYSNKNLNKVGYDPALNLKKLDDITFINDYFTSNKFPFIKKAKVVTAIAMFYDLPNPIKFCEEVLEILDKDGVFVVQFTDLLSMFKVTAFDNICHEHLEYYRLRDIYNLFRLVGLSIVDVSYNNVNGGSLRVIAKHNVGKNDSDIIKLALSYEEDFLKNNGITEFRHNTEKTIWKVREFLNWAKKQKKVIGLLGASTKGNTFLQLCGITNSDIPFAGDLNKDKFGLRTAGSNIEIVSEDACLIKHPDYLLVPIWHFRDSILSNTKILDYLRSNGRLIFPLPRFTVYTDNGGYEV